MDPNAYVEPGFPKGVMPPFSTLPKDQLDGLVQFLAESSKGAEVTAITADQHPPRFGRRAAQDDARLLPEGGLDPRARG